ncbi:hypothetical protein [Halarcobacter sp.]|uniref:hypothetical protein n=1 Tax=Halarcobacter sp. TaxID=2321133 RepID=UPI0029F4E342|nr:hypothetical protein [Halarcobacter sp.]
MELFENLNKKEKIDKIIENFKGKEKYNYFKVGSNSKRKIKVRRLLNSIKSLKSFIILEQKKIESQSWEFVAADVTVLSKNNTKNDNLFNENEYKYIGFDIYVDLIQGVVFKSIFIQFSYHSLFRLLERCDMTQLNSAEKIKWYLSSMIKQFVLRCFNMLEEKIKILSHNKTEEKVFSSLEDYIIIDDLFFPIVMEIGKNRMGKIAFNFTIKTLMPKEYNGSQKTINSKAQNKTKKNILDYSEVLRDLIVQKY